MIKPKNVSLNFILYKIIGTRMSEIKQETCKILCWKYLCTKILRIDVDEIIVLLYPGSTFIWQMFDFLRVLYK